MHTTKKINRSDLKEKEQQMLPPCDLAGDLIIDVLSRLPVKSLKRFSCVCKSWQALLTNPNFIKLQLIKQNPFKKILVTRLNHETLYRVLSLYNNSETSVDMRIPSRMLYSLQSLNIVGSCNGLLCISQEDPPNGIFLWNPATRQLRSLPEPQIGPGLDLSTVAFGFGSDPVTDDYKLVRFVWHDDNYLSGSYRLRTEVYRLSSDCWRETKAADLLTVSPLHYSRTFVNNGFLYWVGINVPNHRRCIVSFNVGAELFREIELPNSEPPPSAGMRLAVFRGSMLALFLYSIVEDLNRCFDLWVMNDDGVCNSWSKQFTIGPFSRVARPLGLWKNGEGVIFGYREKLNEELFMYNYNPNMQEKIKDFPTRGDGLIAGGVHYYVESLVSVQSSVW